VHSLAIQVLSESINRRNFSDPKPVKGGDYMKIDEALKILGASEEIREKYYKMQCKMQWLAETAPFPTHLVGKLSNQANSNTTVTTTIKRHFQELVCLTSEISEWLRPMTAQFAEELMESDVKLSRNSELYAEEAKLAKRLELEARANVDTVPRDLIMVAQKLGRLEMLSEALNAEESAKKLFTRIEAYKVINAEVQEILTHLMALSPDTKLPPGILRTDGRGNVRVLPDGTLADYDAQLKATHERQMDTNGGNQ
jgi:hypothetical protein